MIDKDLIDIVAEFNFWHKKQDTGIKRAELKEITNLLGVKDTVLILLGVRRSGKTTISKQLLEQKAKGLGSEQTLYINFEDNRLQPFLNEELLDNIYESYRHYINKKKFAYIVLDEVQNVPEWERWVRTVLEKKENVKLIVTGSGSRILTPKLASILTGRKITYHLYPLSLRDFLEFKGVDKTHFTKKEQETLLKDYMEFGGFPLVALTENKDQKKYFLQEVYVDIIIRDVMQRFGLREENLLKKTAYLVSNSFSKYVSVRKTRNDLKSITKNGVSPSTLNKYLKYFERSFIFVFLSIFSHNIKDSMQYPRKAYCIDTGLLNAVLPKLTEDWGKLYENLVCVELLRRLDASSELYYWRDHEKREVDFIVRAGRQIKQLIQVCYDISNEKTKKREIDALSRASEELKCNDLLIITHDLEKTEKIKGKKIKYVPLWNWLLR